MLYLKIFKWHEDKKHLNGKQFNFFLVLEAVYGDTAVKN